MQIDSPTPSSSCTSATKAHKINLKKKCSQEKKPTTLVMRIIINVKRMLSKKDEELTINSIYRNDILRFSFDDSMAKYRMKNSRRAKKIALQK